MKAINVSIKDTIQFDCYTFRRIFFRLEIEKKINVTLNSPKHIKNETNQV